MRTRHRRIPPIRPLPGADCPAGPGPARTASRSASPATVSRSASPATVSRSARLAAAAALACVVMFSLAACGPTAEQFNARESVTSPATVTAAPTRPAAPTPSIPAAPSPEPSPTPQPLKVGVSGSQTGMAQPVQDACQFLLRRDPAALPAEEAASCVQAAMDAGGGATQTLETASSWLPPGTHTIEFTTAPEFSLTLENPDLNLRITAGAGGGSVDTGGGRIAAVPGGTPEEAYAAVLASAAELTVNPERVAELIAGSAALAVDYDAVLNGAVRTKISGLRPDDAAADDMMPTGVTLWLDDYYRPVRFELTGSARGITSTITAVNSGWAS